MTRTACTCARGAPEGAKEVDRGDGWKCARGVEMRVRVDRVGAQQAGCDTAWTHRVQHTALR